MRSDDYPLAPMVLGLILGPIAESNLRRSLQVSGGSLDIIYTSPIAMVILVFSLLSLGLPFIRRGIQQYRA